ncbi:MAG: hypothetical protein R3F30_04620 [Planctomycetota bacterium]
MWHPTLAVATSVLGLWSPSSALPVQTPALVKDIDTTPVVPVVASQPSIGHEVQSTDEYRYVRIGSTAYFVAVTDAAGVELWRTDGTKAGTTMVKDIKPGPAGSNPYHLCVAGGRLYFQADDGANGSELWVSDGTQAGTTMVADINPGPTGSWPGYLAPLGTSVVFAAGDAKSGVELWISDGTAKGTKLVKDIEAGTGSSQPRHCRAIRAGTKVFFAASDSANGEELWVTDGTAAGTVLVKDLYKGTSSSSPIDLQQLGAAKVLFTADDGTPGTELWSSDGTAAGTVLVKDFVTPAQETTIALLSGAPLGKLPNHYVFEGWDASAGFEWWVTDGTPTGTFLLADIYPGNGSGTRRGSLANPGGRFFACSDALQTKVYMAAYTGSAYQIWVTDGTTKGTLLHCASAGLDAPEFLEDDGNGRLVFAGFDLVKGSGREPCVTDGTAKGTQLLKDLWPGTSPWLVANDGLGSYMTRIATGQVLFYGDDGSGSEPWTTQGTPSTTVLVRDINPWPYGPVTEDDDVRDIEPLFDRVLFTADDGKTGSELWRSDGTAAGTALVADIAAGPAPSYPSHKVRLGNEVLFRANDGVSGYELWITDGTKAGTRMLLDINPGLGSSYPGSMQRFGEFVWFQANDGQHGFEPWITNGTAAGTRMISDIATGYGSSYPTGFTWLNGVVYFQAGEPKNGTELWRSNGTDRGTYLVSDIHSGILGSYPEHLAVLGNKLYFAAWTQTYGTELYVSDGTTQGTGLLLDLYPGPSSGHPSWLCVQGGALWFGATDGKNGFGLWRSDGTAKGTAMQSLGAFYLVPVDLTPVGSRRIWLSGLTASAGREPYALDTSTTPFTFRSWDLNPAGDSAPLDADPGYGFAVQDGYVWLRARTSPQTDHQLWRVANGGTAQEVGRRGPTTLLTATDPLINRTMRIDATTGVANTVQVLFLGVPAAAPPPAFGGFVYFDLLQPWVTVAGGATLSLTVPVPNDPGLVDQRAMLQAWAFDAKAFPQGTEPSNGVHLVVGNSW